MLKCIFKYTRIYFNRYKNKQYLYKNKQYLYKNIRSKLL